jgi:undecaprenyl-diphosphatase
MGILFEDLFESLFGSPCWVALFLLVTGVWLVVAERLGRREKQAEQLTLGEALLIGVAQGCAIAPGISRSGATIGAGLVAGLKRESAARFSFLLSIPIILAAGLLQTIRVIDAGGLGVATLPLVAGFIAGFVSGTLCIRWLLAELRRRSLAVFAVYCWVAGALALGLMLVR